MQTLPSPPRLAQQARADFDSARQTAFLHAIGAFFRRRPNWLLPYDDVTRLLPISGQRYRGIRPIPVAAIRGSVDRYREFDRDFFPRRSHTRARWESVDRAGLASVNLPPIQVYQVGAVYFVRDGNHRVSVARQQGMDYIDAEIVEVRTPVPLTPDVDPRDLLALGERAQFLAATHLDTLRPAATFDCTGLGCYDRLQEHIRGHQWLLGVEHGRAFTWEEAVQSWYDLVYAPLLALIAEHDVLSAFPGRTATDLYLWIVEYAYYESLAHGHSVGLPAALQSFAAQRLGTGRRLLQRLARWRRRAGAVAGRMSHMRPRGGTSA